MKGGWTIFGVPVPRNKVWLFGKSGPTSTPGLRERERARFGSRVTTSGFGRVGLVEEEGVSWYSIRKMDGRERGKKSNRKKKRRSLSLTPNNRGASVLPAYGSCLCCCTLRMREMPVSYLFHWKQAGMVLLEFRTTCKEVSTGWCILSSDLSTFLGVLIRYLIKNMMSRGRDGLMIPRGWWLGLCPLWFHPRPVFEILNGGFELYQRS